MRTMLARTVVLTATATIVGGCAGDGSDIGPTLPRLPDASCKVQAFDDDNVGVVSAHAAIVGTSIEAVTGRNGRGDFLANPRGRQVVQVDGRNGAATEGDLLAVIAAAMQIDGPDVPLPIHVPDLQGATAGATLPAGAVAGATPLTSADGSIVTLPMGSSIGTPDAATSIEVRVGDLSQQHLPGDLPMPATGTILFGRGVFVSPADLTITGGADIDVVDDLAGATQTRLYHLDSATGEWQQTAVTGTAAAGRLTATGAITSGGLYAFGAEVAATTVAGVLLDAGDEPAPVPEAIVRVDQRYAVSAADGSFLVTGVPATAADGSARMARFEVFAGGWWLPKVREDDIAVSAAPVDVGDVVFDTVRAGNVRVQRVVRARADVFQPARLSSLTGDVALRAATDRDGQAIFEDVPFGYYGSQQGRLRDPREVFYGTSLGFAFAGRRWDDQFQYSFQRPWFLGTRICQAYVCDFVGGGPLDEAVVIEGDGLDGVVRLTQLNGLVIVDRQFGLQATAAVETTRDGETISHVFTVKNPSSDHIEFPMRRVLRQPLGRFDRHGLVAGTLQDVTGGREHGIRTTRRIELQEWWGEIVDGDSMRSRLPIDVDPQTTNGPFRVGVDAAGGNVAAIEYTVGAGGNELNKVGMWRDLEVPEGELTTDDLPLSMVATSEFALVGAAASAGADVDLNALDLALGLLQPSGLVVDVARDLGGSYAVDGADLDLTLPPLTGELAGSRWLALLQGQTTAASVTSAHASVVEVGAAQTDFAFRDFPTITSPAPMATVPTLGFVVEFSLPAGSVGGMVELRSTTTPLRLWQVVVRPDETGVLLQVPADVPTALVGATTYTLTVTAWFGDVDIVSPYPYGDFAAFAQSISPVEAGVRQYTSRSFSVSTP